MAQNIDARDLRERMRAGANMIIVNVLSEGSYRARHLPGSISLPVDDIDARAAAVLPDQDREVVVYCASPQCLASAEAADRLERLGYRRVIRYEGGISEWKKEGYPLEGDAV